MGVIESREEIKVLDLQGGYCRVETDGEKELPSFVKAVTSGCGGIFSLINVLPDRGNSGISDFSLRGEEIAGLMKSFQRKSETYRKTGGTHSAALSDGGKILIFAEDIGRHNAFDRVIGMALAGGIPFEDKVLLTSGRISSEIVAKCIRAGLPVIISRSAPTDYAVKVAENFGIAVVGFARGERYNIYSRAERILLP